VPTQCLFCGTRGRKITKEHVWPQWLVDFVPVLPPGGHTERWSSAVGRETSQQPILSSTVKAFCNDCNNGWMSKLEGAAKPIVGPMTTGKAMDLDAVAQQIVANWFAVKGLVAVQTNRLGQPIPDSHYRRVHQFGGAPPNTMRVWIGYRWNLLNPKRADMVQLFDFHYMPIRDAFAEQPLPPNIQNYRSAGGVFNATLFQLGHFFVLALQHDWPGLHVRPKPGTEGADALLPIWPAGPTLQWPPSQPVDVLGDPHKVTRFLQMPRQWCLSTARRNWSSFSAPLT
jgi:hypothetical protein